MGGGLDLFSPLTAANWSLKKIKIDQSHVKAGKFQPLAHLQS